LRSEFSTEKIFEVWPPESSLESMFQDDQSSPKFVVQRSWFGMDGAFDLF